MRFPCGRTERPARSLGELQRILDDDVDYHNDVRPQRAVGRRTPSVACNARARAKPHTLIHPPRWRTRTGRVDVRGHVTLRFLRTPRHLDVGWPHRGQVIKLFVLDDLVTFATEDVEFIGETTIHSARDHQPKVDNFARYSARVHPFTMT